MKFHIAENTIHTETQLINDILNENKNFPVLTIGTDSYIQDAVVKYIFDENLLYNLQIGKHSSLAENITFLIDLNHDYKRVCQGYIDGSYHHPEFLKRKGQIIIMNDCWIGNAATIFSGVTVGNGAVVAANSVITKDVPPYAIVAGNPAKIIGYRFKSQQIKALQIIQWWNWPHEKIKSCLNDLFGDIDTFIAKHLESAKLELSKLRPVDIAPIKKKNSGEEKRLFYIPDFEQDYPTWPKVIESFIQSYSDTNYELLLYIEKDNKLNEKLALLNIIFSKYEDANCYLNLYIENIQDMRTLMCQADAYITNRNLNNIIYMDMANLFNLPIYSSVDMPIFHERKISSMIKTDSI